MWNQQASFSAPLTKLVVSMWIAVTQVPKKKISVLYLFCCLVLVNLKVEDRAKGDINFYSIICHFSVCARLIFIVENTQRFKLTLVSVLSMWALRSSSMLMIDSSLSGSDLSLQRFSKSHATLRRHDIVISCAIKTANCWTTPPSIRLSLMDVPSPIILPEKYKFDIK